MSDESETLTLRGGDVVIRAGEFGGEFVCDPPPRGYHGSCSRWPNRRDRLIACWNACRLIPTDVLRVIAGESSDTERLAVLSRAAGDAGRDRT